MGTIKNKTLHVEFLKPNFLINRLSGSKLHVVNVLGNANLLANSRMHGFVCGLFQMVIWLNTSHMGICNYKCVKLILGL